MALITIDTDFLRKVSALPYPKSEYVVLYIEKYCENGPDEIPTRLFETMFDYALSYADAQCKLDCNMQPLSKERWDAIAKDSEFIPIADFIKVLEKE